MSHWFWQTYTTRITDTILPVQPWVVRTSCEIDRCDSPITSSYDIVFAAMLWHIANDRIAPSMSSIQIASITVCMPRFLKCWLWLARSAQTTQCWSNKPSPNKSSDAIAASDSIRNMSTTTYIITPDTNHSRPPMSTYIKGLSLNGLRFRLFVSQLEIFFQITIEHAQPQNWLDGYQVNLPDNARSTDI